MRKVFDFEADVSKKNRLGFNDALPIGNGTMGAMVYGGTFEEKLILNEDSLWLGKEKRKRENLSFKKYLPEIKKLMDDGRIKEAEKLVSLACYSNPKGECIYSVAGSFHLLFEHKNVNHYQRILDLEKGLVEVSYDLENNSIKRTYFASYPDQVIVINVASRSNISFSCYLDREKLVDKVWANQDTLFLKYEYSHNKHLIIMVKAISDGLVENIGSSLIFKNTKNTTFYICLATSYYHKNPQKWCEKKIFNLDYQTIKNNHINDYQRLYFKQLLETEDEQINYFYALSRYLMICSSRLGSQPANLQGIWCQDIFPSWDSKYTININTQMNYWNVFHANLSECSLPLFELLRRMQKNGKRIAKKMYGVRGSVAFHNTDLYGDCAPQDWYLPATMWPLGGAWLCLFIYEYYLFTKDIHFLKNNAYIIRNYVRFFEDVLEKNERQEYILNPSLSPENSYYLNHEIVHLCKGATMDREILYDLFNAMAHINQILGLKDNKVIENIMNHLPSIKVGKYNQIMEWNEDFEEAELGHRHISQLYGLYPSFQINEKEPLLFKAAKTTIERRLANGGGHTGWSKAWIMAMLARLNEKEEAYQCFSEWVLQSTSRVGLDLHPPFQIDGNFGIAAAIFELFVRESNVIELLPALPTSLSSGSFKGICLKNKVTMTIKWNQGKLTYLELNALENTTISIICRTTLIEIPTTISLKAKQKLIIE